MSITGRKLKRRGAGKVPYPMRVIDVASYQTGIDLSKIKTDGVIAKATEGIGYTNPAFIAQYDQAKQLNLCRGIYHFARPSSNTATSEAAYFVNTIGARGRDPGCLLVLDYEDATTDPAWALAWIEEVARLTGKRAAIYMSQSVVNAHDWAMLIAANVELWVAMYADMTADPNWVQTNADFLPKITWGSKGYMMWQWTSVGQLTGWNGNIDCNWFYGTPGDWVAYASRP